MEMKILVICFIKQLKQILKGKKKASARNKVKITETIKHIHDDVHNWYHLT